MLALQTMSGASPEYAEMVATSGVDVTNRAAVQEFVLASGFLTDDSIDEAAKDDVIQRLDLPDPRARTGGDINDIYKNGYGRETYQDENGVYHTRQVPLTRNDRVPIGEGQEIGLDDTGGRAIWVETVVGKYSASNPEQASDQDMGSIVRTIQMRASLPGMNMADIFYPDAEVFERGGGTIKIRTEDYIITEKLRSILIGHEAIDGNKVFSDDDLANIPYLMQFHSRRGDYVTGDVDPVQMREDYRAQGIIDKDGHVDWERFEQLVMANRANMYTAPQDFEGNVEQS